MGWDRYEHDATCGNCGKQGKYIRAENDWGQSSITWIGFEPAPDLASAERVIRQKESHDSFAKCECGSHNIRVGEVSKVS